MAVFAILVKKYVFVPDVYNMTQANAESAITSAGLTVGTVNEDYHATIIEGNVYDQSPAAGTKVPIDTSVNIDVSLGVEEITVNTSFQVVADADDGYSRGTGFGTVHPVVGDAYNAYARLTNVTIPKDATINSAYVKVWQNGSEGSENVDCRIYARDHGNTGNPTIWQNLTNSDPVSPGSSGWLLTTASVAWDNLPNVGGGGNYDSPSITSIIQEIVNRGDWVSGNALCLVLKDTTSSSNHERIHQNADDNGYRLNVNYTYTP